MSKEVLSDGIGALVR